MMTDGTTVVVQGVPSPAELERFQGGPFIVVHHRAGSSVYWGPFASMDEIRTWVKEHGFTVEVLPLNDPNGDSRDWW